MNIKDIEAKYEGVDMPEPVAHRVKFRTRLGGADVTDYLMVWRKAEATKQVAEHLIIDVEPVVTFDQLRETVAAAVAKERERWQRVADNAQAVTTGCTDKVDHFEVPGQLMAALALALDEAPNATME